MKKFKKILAEIKTFNFVYAYNAIILGIRQMVVAYKIMKQVRWKPDFACFVLETTSVTDKRGADIKKQQEEVAAAERQKQNVWDTCTCLACETRRQIEKQNQPVVH